MLKNERHLHPNDDVFNNLAIADNREVIRNEIEFMSYFGQKVVVYCVIFNTEDKILLVNPPKPNLERDFLRFEIPQAQQCEGDKAIAQRIHKELNRPELSISSLRSIYPTEPLLEDEDRLRISVASRINFLGSEPMLDPEKYFGYTWARPSLLTS